MTKELSIHLSAKKEEKALQQDIDAKTKWDFSGIRGIRKKSMQNMRRK